MLVCCPYTPCLSLAWRLLVSNPGRTALISGGWRNAMGHKAEGMSACIEHVVWGAALTQTHGKLYRVTRAVQVKAYCRLLCYEGQQQEHQSHALCPCYQYTDH